MQVGRHQPLSTTHMHPYARAGTTQVSPAGKLWSITLAGIHKPPQYF